MIVKEYQKHLTIENRLQFEALLKSGLSIPKAGKLIGCSRATAYNEYNRGITGPLLRSDLTEYYTYDAFKAQRDYDEKATNKGTREKLGNDMPFALFVAKKIKEEKFSPYAALVAAHEAGIFVTDICVRTLYNYIDREYIPEITNKDLPQRGERKKKYRKVTPRTRKPLQRSIEERPKEIQERKEFGHWELECVLKPSK